MKKETCYSIVSICCMIAVFVGILFLQRSCKKEKEAERLVKECQEKINIAESPYLYVDKNNVYHIKQNCWRLNDDYYIENENGYEIKADAVYSSKRVMKSDIHNWVFFSTTHHLCTECFDDEYIIILDSIENNKKHEETSTTPYSIIQLCVQE